MIDGADRELFAEALAQAATGADGAPLDDVLRGFGWRDALTDDPRTAVSVLFELQGRTATTSDALDAVMAPRLGGGDGERGVLLPVLGAALAPGRIVGGTVEVDGLIRCGAATPKVVTVAVADATVVAVPTDRLDLAPVDGLDPSLGLVAASGSVDAPDTSSASSASAWPDAVAAGRRALAHELVGGARTMLELARDHAVERIQFGRPIASFQAVRHRLAEAHVAVEGAAAAIDAAWEDGTGLSAAAAKAIAGRAARVVARHAQQVLAGIGFTTEHPLHRHVRRTLVLDGLLGDARTITRTMGEDLLASRRLPPLPLL